MRREMRRSTIRMLAAVVPLAVAVTLAGRPALAACHAFTLEADPDAVDEGGEVTLTVRRDAAVAPSQIDVSTVDGTAEADQDYEPVATTISFTDETEQTLTISTMDDDSQEPAETFRVHLSNPGGCSVNPSFVVGPPVRVTISDDDASASPSRTTASPTTEAEATTPSPTASPTPTVTERAASEDGDGGLSGAAIAGIAAAAGAVIATVVFGLMRRRGGRAG